MATTQLRRRARAPECRRPIRPGRAVRVCTAPDDSIWYLRAQLAQCTARLHGASCAVIRSALSTTRPDDEHAHQQP